MGPSPYSYLQIMLQIDVYSIHQHLFPSPKSSFSLSFLKSFFSFFSYSLTKGAKLKVWDRSKQ